MSLLIETMLNALVSTLIDCVLPASDQNAKANENDSAHCDMTVDYSDDDKSVKLMNEGSGRKCVSISTNSVRTTSTAEDGPRSAHSEGRLSRTDKAFTQDVEACREGPDPVVFEPIQDGGEENLCDDAEQNNDDLLAHQNVSTEDEREAELVQQHNDAELILELKNENRRLVAQTAKLREDLYYAECMYKTLQMKDDVNTRKMTEMATEIQNLRKLVDEHLQMSGSSDVFEKRGRVVPLTSTPHNRTSAVPAFSISPIAASESIKARVELDKTFVIKDGADACEEPDRVADASTISPLIYDNKASECQQNATYTINEFCSPAVKDDPAKPDDDSSHSEDNSSQPTSTVSSAEPAKKRKRCTVI